MHRAARRRRAAHVGPVRVVPEPADQLEACSRRRCCATASAARSRPRRRRAARRCRAAAARRGPAPRRCPRGSGSRRGSVSCQLRAEVVGPHHRRAPVAVLDAGEDPRRAAGGCRCETAATSCASRCGPSTRPGAAVVVAAGEPQPLARADGEQVGHGAPPSRRSTSEVRPSPTQRGTQRRVAPPAPERRSPAAPLGRRVPPSVGGRVRSRRSPRPSAVTSGASFSALARSSSAAARSSPARGDALAGLLLGQRGALLRPRPARAGRGRPAPRRAPAPCRPARRAPAPPAGARGPAPACAPAPTRRALATATSASSASSDDGDDDDQHDHPGVHGRPPRIAADGCPRGPPPGNARRRVRRAAAHFSALPACHWSHGMAQS